MTHWAQDYFDRFKETTELTGWELQRPPESNPRAPVIFNHEDGSELSFVHPPTGTYAVEYTGSDDATDAITDEHTSWGTPDDAVNWVEHVLTRHENVN